MNVKKAMLGAMIAAAGGAVLSQSVVAEPQAEKDKELNGKTQTEAKRQLQDKESKAKSEEKTEKSEAKSSKDGDGKTAKGPKSCPAEGKAKNGKECLGCGKG